MHCHRVLVVRTVWCEVGQCCSLCMLIWRVCLPVSLGQPCTQRASAAVCPSDLAAAREAQAVAEQLLAHWSADTRLTTASPKLKVGSDKNDRWNEVR